MSTGKLIKLPNGNWEIPSHIEPYFDREKWKADARHDGRGHALSSYDGHEYDETIGGTTYYIYRIN